MQGSTGPGRSSSSRSLRRCIEAGVSCCITMKENQPGIVVPYSAGRNVPENLIPAGACDCHHHIFDPEHFPYVPTDTLNFPPAAYECYQMLKERLGISRNVIVQPSSYGTDNRCTLNALEKMGKENTRAVVVVDGRVSDEDLIDMDEKGVRGIRFNINRGGSSDWGMIQRLCERIAPLKWSVNFWMGVRLVTEKEDFLRSLPCEVVFDHRGNIPEGAGRSHHAVKIISRMLREEKAWVKLSGMYFGAVPPGYAGAVEIGSAYVEANPDRCLWGTDWPHVVPYSSSAPMPNDADMLDLLMDQAGGTGIFHRILVDNPAGLYGFDR